MATNSSFVKNLDISYLTLDIFGIVSSSRKVILHDWEDWYMYIHYFLKNGNIIDNILNIQNKYMINVE